MLKVCIDANVYISAIVFGGKPKTILELAFNRKYTLVTSAVIINEAHRNLVGKLKFPEEVAQEVFEKILNIAAVYEPLGQIQYINHAKDTLVLETALLGRCDILVTGDKKDLLPLREFQGIIIEPPSAFLNRINVI